MPEITDAVKLSPYAQLAKLQQRIKVPKEQYNSFGKYKYRSCEDIIEAAKKTFSDGELILLSDEAVLVGHEIYIKATATFICNGGQVSCNGFARESMDKKGMDSAQMSGTASSYARKYALNGLLLIDDTKDSDSDEHKKEQSARVNKNDEAKKLESATKFIDKLCLDILTCKSKDALTQLQTKNADSIKRILEGYNDLAAKYTAVVNETLKQWE